ncbi:hypothetical protein VTP01DRAFT_1657 [Rhizomucor pusillus]|uniref:uncharacterized protein n=1 Tax=Rhizomucor pusillus TaxID=4840 RepID=UPI0037430D83
MTSTSWNFLQTNISEEEINNEEALIQQNNKNRKCILSSLQKRCRASGGSDSNLNPMFIDVIGYQGYLYTVYNVDDAFVAAKVTENEYIYHKHMWSLKDFLLTVSCTSYFITKYA